MAGKQEPEVRPLGVPLDDVAQGLRHADATCTFVTGGMLVEHGGDFQTLVSVTEPEPGESPGPVRAIVRIRTELPDPIRAILCSEPTLAQAFNKAASLGAIVVEGDECYVASRLSVHEESAPWNILVPLITVSILTAAPSILGAIPWAPADRQSVRTESAWSERDFDAVQPLLSNFWVATAGETGLTVEFPLDPEVLGGIRRRYAPEMRGPPPDTALWSAFTDPPHPGLGGGLLCVLEFPVSFGEESSLWEALAKLNLMEMEGRDLPPHFGAWCPGNHRNPAYVSFLPNILHGVAGLLAHVPVWASFRANIAAAALMGG